MTGNRPESSGSHRSCGTAKLVVLQSKTSNNRSHQNLPFGNPLVAAQDPTIATALKAQGYDTGQFGKNHTVTPEVNSGTKRLLINKRALIVGACGGPGERDSSERRQ
jgi:arylsulfatase A-like enzyme